MELSPILQVGYYAIITISAVGSIVAGVMAWSAKQAVKSARIAESAAQVPTLKKTIEQQQVEMTDQRHRLREMEQKLAAKPTVDMVHAIQLAIARVEGRIESYSVELKSVSKAADAAVNACNRMEEYFVEKGIKA